MLLVVAGQATVEVALGVVRLERDTGVEAALRLLVPAGLGVRDPEPEPRPELPRVASRRLSEQAGRLAVPTAVQQRGSGQVEVAGRRRCGLQLGFAQPVRLVGAAE